MYSQVHKITCAIGLCDEGFDQSIGVKTAVEKSFIN